MRRESDGISLIPQGIWTGSHPRTRRSLQTFATRRLDRLGYPLATFSFVDEDGFAHDYARCTQDFFHDSDANNQDNVGATLDSRVSDSLGNHYRKDAFDGANSTSVHFDSNVDGNKIVEDCKRSRNYIYATLWSCGRLGLNIPR